MEVVDVDRRFQEFVLYLFDDYILTINQYKDISRPQVNRVCPALHRGVERMPGCSLDLFSVDEHTPPFWSVSSRRNPSVIARAARPLIAQAAHQRGGAVGPRACHGWSSSGFSWRWDVGNVRPRLPCLLTLKSRLCGQEKCRLNTQTTQPRLPPCLPCRHPVSPPHSVGGSGRRIDNHTRGKPLQEVPVQSGGSQQRRRP